MEKEPLSKIAADLSDGWEQVIAELGVEGMERPSLAGGWRVRDVLAHINGWDRWQVVQLRCAFSGETPTEAELTGGIPYPPNDHLQEDAMNAMFIAGTKDIVTEEIVRHWREITEMRSHWIGSASQEQLDTLIGEDWSGSSPRIFRLVSEVPTVKNPHPVWNILLDQVEHSQEHLKIVRDVWNI